MQIENKKPTVSVIVPVYKAEEYLNRCVDSILAQTFTDFEVILVDDGSPDSCGEICDDYARRDPRVRAFHKENGGVSSARNMGLNHARGEWIAFVDADDWVGDGYLDVFHDTAILLNTDIIHFGFQIENAHGRVYKQYAFPKTVSIPASALLKKGVFSSCTISYFFRTACVGCIRFNKNLHYSEDREFIIKVVLGTYSPVLLTTNTAYFYAYHPTSTTKRRRNAENSLDDLVALENVCRHICQNHTQLDNNTLHFICHLFTDSFFLVYSSLSYRERRAVKARAQYKISHIKTLCPTTKPVGQLFLLSPIAVTFKERIYTTLRHFYHILSK